jgi:hypothetical protein
MDAKLSPNVDPYATAPAPAAGRALALPATAFFLMFFASALVRQYREVTIPAVIAAGAWLTWVYLKRK